MLFGVDDLLGVDERDNKIETEKHFSEFKVHSCFGTQVKQLYLIKW